MRFLLVYDFCAACIRREPWALQALGEVSVEEVAVSAVTVGQLMASALVGASNKAEAAARLQAIRAFLVPIQVLPFGTKEASGYAATAAFLLDRGFGIEEAEVQALATAEAHGLTVVTAKTGVTSQIASKLKGLKQVDWAAEGQGRGLRAPRAKRR